MTQQFEQQDPFNMTFYGQVTGTRTKTRNDGSRVINISIQSTIDEDMDFYGLYNEIANNLISITLVSRQSSFKQIHQDVADAADKLNETIDITNVNRETGEITAKVKRTK